MVASSRILQMENHRVNEMILIETGKISADMEGQQGANNFVTDSYLAGLYEAE